MSIIKMETQKTIRRKILELKVKKPIVHVSKGERNESI